MIDLVKKYFSGRTKGIPFDQEKGTHHHNIQIATCALLLEMSGIDGEFSGVERDSIISILKRDYGLSDENAEALIESSNEELKGSVDLWQFTNLINQNYSEEEKISVIEAVWRIVYADGKLAEHEDYLVHKLANLLRLTHKQLIDAKLRVRAET
ncbi:MAG: TerB family tellurite resistance protein [Thermodesulfobacteriota bacterium]|nr:TerB family tellurite resistance protein [Thermodesulfobacteriota bacterium]